MPAAITEDQHLAITRVHSWDMHKYVGMSNYTCDLADGMANSDSDLMQQYEMGVTVWVCDDCARRIGLIW